MLTHYFKKLSINAFILSCFLFIFFINLLTGGVYLFTKINGIEVDIAGSNRALSQRIFLSALQYADKKEEYLGEKLKNEIEKHEEVIQILKKGGMIRYENKQLGLNPASKQIAPSLNEAEKFWITYKEKALLILKNVSRQADSINEQKNKILIKDKAKIKEALNYLQNNADEMFRKNDAVVKALINENRQKNNLSSAILITGFVLSALVIILSLVFLKYKFKKPLDSLSKISEKIAGGNYQEQVNIQSYDELGSLAASVNKLFHKIKLASVFVKQIGEGSSDEQINIEIDANAKNDSFFQSLLTMQKQIQESKKIENTNRWINEGVAHLSNILQNAGDIRQLCDQLLSYLVQYLGVCQ